MPRSQRRSRRRCPISRGGLGAQAGPAHWRVTVDGLGSLVGTPLPAARAEDVFAALNLLVIPAEIRNGDEEVHAAKMGALPTLLSRTDIHGALHMPPDF